MEENKRERILYGIEFEKKVLNFISSYLSDEERIGFDDYITSARMHLDAYLPKGSKAFNWPPKTAIEIKIKPMPDTIYRFINLLGDRKEYSSIVMICDILPNDAFLNRFYREEYDGIEILSFSSLQKSIDKSAFKSSGKSYLLSEEEQAKKLMEEISYSMENSKVTLFLGAGVSMSSNLPSWNKLMKDVLANQNGKPYNHLGEANTESVVESCGFSAIVTGRYAYDGYGNMDEFVQRIHDSLYKDVRPSKLIDSICSLILDKKISQIITYNYDDLIETALDSMNYKSYYSVYGKNRELSNSFRIYHVHGMIPQRQGIKSTPILSEKDYHQLYRDSHNWSNVVQLFSLNNTTCVFIGLSMNDPNLRRLLDFSVSDEGIAKTDKDIIPHYVFLQKRKLKGEESKRANKEHWKEQERMMNQLGLNVIWYNSFEELPILLSQL